MKVAFVVQRYGVEVTGGAEQHCRAVARRLAGEHQVTVLTTCALDHSTWENHYPPGEELLEGVQVLRFPIARGRDRDFDAYTQSFYGQSHSRVEELQWLEKQGPTSPALLGYIQASRDDYHALVFYTYLYSPTFFGLPLAADKAILVPTAHDEPPIHLGIFKELFSLPRGILFLTPAEQRFVQGLFHNGGIPSQVVGTGIEGPSQESRPERFRQRYGVRGDFLLYVGRVEGGKGCGQMVDFFCRYKARFPEELSLVLVGRGDMALPQRPDLRALGFVPEEDKWDALAAASLLVAPSPYESLSIVALEAWHQGLPVLANGHCAVLVEQCLASNGGLFYVDYPEFEACLRMLLSNHPLRQALGDKGRDYVRKNYAWPAVLARWGEALERVAEGASSQG